MKLLIMALPIVAGLLLAHPGPVSAQERSPAIQAELIQTLLSRIEQLEKRVSELEGPKVAAPAEVVHAESTQPTTDATNLKIAGFGDFTFGGSDQPGSKSGFNEGQFILHLNSISRPK